MERFTIVPAHPGFRALYWDDGEKTLFAMDHVIAWRVETVIEKNSEPFNTVIAIGVDGSLESCVGYLTPDGSVSLWDMHFDTLEAAQVYAKERAEN